LSKKLILILLLIVIIGVPVIFLAKGNKNYDFLSTEIYSMNTIIQIKISGKDKKEATEAIINEINLLNEKFDDFSPVSDVSRINNNAGKSLIEVDKTTIDIISKAIDCYKRTNGAFDISIAPLSKLWGFKENTYRVPSPSEINQTLNFVNIEDVIVEGNKVMLKKPEDALDFGGIAKGYTLDKIKEILPNFDLKNAIINMGGNILTYGDSNKGSWLIGIKHPRGDGTVGKIAIKGSKFISTSGDYERFFIENGKRYCHIIDPSTGYPSDKIISISVISDAGYFGDALSTAFFVLGKEKSLELAKILNVEIIGFDENLEPFFTEGIKKDFSLEEGR
jgi:thiamine biosynthesis lipoprotein